MTEVISVRFRGGCKSYFFDPQGVAVQPGDSVVVETAQGAEVGTCVSGNHMVEDHAVIQPLRPMRRLATENDLQIVERNRRLEKEARGICEKKIAAHGLEMKLVDVECGFEGNKIIFFFTADGRVDFRELVKDLAGVFHSRIELRQIGVRDEAKMLGGLGICGQALCCRRFLDEFQPVSIKMAKTQNLSLNPTKISGSCGRLMCCLKYEQHAYEDAQTRMPKNDSFVQTPDGPGNISAINLVKETVTVRLDDAPEAPKTYQVGEIIVLRNGKGSRDGIEIPERPARIVREPELDAFGMEISTPAPSVRQFRNSPPMNRQREKREEGGERGGRRTAAKAAEPQRVKENGQQNTPAFDGDQEPRKPRRTHRGGRGRGNRGEAKETIRKEKPAAENRETQPRGGSGANRAPARGNAEPRIVRFGSSMPIADNAAGREQKGEKGDKPRSRGNRRFHRGHGGRGAGGEKNGKEE